MSIDLAPRKVENTFKSLFTRGHSEIPKPRYREISWIGETKKATSVEVCGNKIIIGWTNGHIKIYDAVDLQCLTVLQFGGHPTCFQCTCTELISGHRDGNICVWNIQSGLLMQKFLMGSPADDFPVCMRWRPPKLLVASFDGIVKLWQYTNSSFISLSVSEHRPSSYLDNVRRLEFNTDYMVCLHGSSVRVHYLNGLLAREIVLFGTPTDIALQGDYLIIGCENEKATLSIVDIKTGIYLKGLQGHTASVTALDAKNNFVVSSDKKGQIILWNLAAGKDGNQAAGIIVREPTCLKSVPPRSLHLGQNLIVGREVRSQRIVVTDFTY